MHRYRKACCPHPESRRPSRGRRRQESRLDQIADDIAQYGAAAKDLIPLLIKVRDRRAKQHWNGELMQKDVEAINRAIAVIQADTKPAAILSMKEYIAR